MRAAYLFAMVSAVHAGFQLTVTVLVYPALARTDPGDWTTVHARHSRGIAPLVVLIYGGLVLTGAWVVLSGPSPVEVLAVVLAAAAIVVTAVAAAPLHSRLTTRTNARVGRLLRVDRLRCVLAVAGAAAAAVAVLTA